MSPRTSEKLLFLVLILLGIHRMLALRGFAARALRRQRASSAFINGFPRQGRATPFIVSRPPTGSSSVITIAARRKYTIATKPKSDRPYQLVIVESPSKCKTISRILEKYVTENELEHDYVVASSMGHVRNLPRSASNKSSKKEKQAVVGVNVNNGYKPIYEILPGKESLVSELRSLAQDAQQVILATDEDREGEAVAWHLTQLLPTDVPHVRVTFTEITPTAICEAMESPHELDLNLVEAQETRRVLDRLAGYTLSPILWKKIAPGLSAGRVQSVGMALIVQRERERLLHKTADYWDLEAGFVEQNGQTVNATMVSLNGVPLATGTDFDNQGVLANSKKQHLTADLASELLATLAGGGAYPWSRDPSISSWTVASVKSTKRNQLPPMPFTTSTLQQESNKRLGMSVSQTMRSAQSLYEAGFISYMRTDSTHMSKDAHAATDRVVAKDYGSDLVEPPRNTSSKKKAKNAQEAHEAIRPAVQPDGTFLRPELLSSSDPSAAKLYELIYQRTLASRMSSLVTNQTSVDITGTSPDGETTALFRARGSVVLHPGYTLALGRSSSDFILPPLVEGQELKCVDLEAASHTTQPPPRYNEASFVKALETLGVGRPSTYAHTVQILRDRAYVGTPIRAYGAVQRRNGKPVTGAAISAQRAAGGEEFTGGGRGPLVPSLSAFVVCSLLEKYCPTYVDPEFTAGMEERLDEIAQGIASEASNRVAYLDEFYAGEDGLAAKVKRIDDEVDADDARRADLPSLFSNSTEGEDDIGLFIGPWGPYIQKLPSADSEKPLSAPLPPGMAADLSTITPETLRALLSSRERDGFLLGTHPDDDRDIRLKVGRFGAYLQWGQDGEEGTTTHSLPKHIGGMRNISYSMADGGVAPEESLGDMIGLSFEDAVGYVSLPRTVCELNDLPIVAAIGPYGPYLKYNNSFVSLHKNEGDILTVDAEVAERVVTDGITNKSSKLPRGVIAELGERDGGKVLVRDGRFGKYINWKRVNAKLPAEFGDNPEDLPLDLAWELIQQKAPTTSGKKGSKGRGKTGAKDAIELPSAPKRPLSAYFHFCNEKRPQVMESVKSVGEAAKVLSSLWAETAGNDELRKKYHDLAAEGKKEYEEQKRAWKGECQKLMNAANSGQAQNGAVKKSRGVAKVSSTPAPKRPRSSYLYFCAAKRPDVSKTVKKLGDVSKELAKLWAETDSEGRREYEELAAADKVRYEEEMNRCKAGTLIQGGNAPKKNGAAAPAGKTKTQRAPSAYMLFCSEHRQTIVDEQGNKLPFGETTKRLAEMWRECDDETRSRFEDEAKKKKQQILL